VGMDRRELKKQILFEMLNQYHSIWHQQDESVKRESAAFLMDIDPKKKITDAQYNRYLSVMDELVENAEKKLN
jgi:hypothetical protein